MSQFELITLKSGVTSLRSLDNLETFHPVTGPRIEANILHVTQQRLAERCQAATTFVVWDVGFGAGANVLAAIEALRACTTTHIEIHSFDKTTAPMAFALGHAEQLGYLSAHTDDLKRLLTNGKVQLEPRMQWHLHLGDFGEQLRTNHALPAPNAILYDPYSPVGNPEMWRLEHFRLLRERLDPDVLCLLTNYTRSTAVRVTLLLAGFHVGIGSEVGEKAETTIATNHLEALARPLDRQWLERVLVSRNAAPLRAETPPQTPITKADFEWLQGAPQFQAGPRT